MKNKMINRRFSKKVLAAITAASLLVSGSTAVIYAEDAAAEASAATPVADEDYPNLIEGSLTKSELEFLLGILPWYMDANGWENYDHDMVYLINEVLINATYSQEPAPIGVYGSNAWSASDSTRIFSSFCSIVFSEANIGEVQSYIGNATISGDTLSFLPASPSRDGDATITSAEYSADEMIVHFLLTQDSVDDGTIPNQPKKAILRMSDTGKFKITAIADDDGSAEAAPAETQEAVIEYEEGYEDISVDELEEMGEIDADWQAEGAAENMSADASGSSVSGSDMASAYNAVLDNAQNGAYVFLTEDYQINTSEGVEYFLHDIDQDGIKELFVGELHTVDVFYAHAAKIFTLQQSDSGYSAVEVPLQNASGASANTVTLLNIMIPEDGNGVLENAVYSRGTGDAGITRDSMQNGVFVQETETVLSYRLDDDISYFVNSNPSVTWTPIADRSALTL